MMEPIYFLLLALIGFGAGFVQRVSGFGLGIFAMIFLPHLIPTSSAATVCALFSMVTTTYNCVRHRKNISFKTALPMIASSLVCIPIAVYFSASVSGGLFEAVFGTVLIALSVYFIFFNRRIKIKPTCLNGVLSGTFGGLLQGLFSTGGPPAVLYLSSAATDNITYFATIQFYFCFTNIYSTVTRALGGLVSADIIVYAVLGALGALGGNGVGSLVFSRLNADKLKLVIYVGMIISGVLMIF